MSILDDPRLAHFKTYLHGEARRLLPYVQTTEEDILARRMYQQGIESVQASEVPLLVTLANRALKRGT